MAELHDRECEAPDQADYLEDTIDFSRVHADDAFLDALGAAEPDPSGEFADDKLAELLLSWRHDVDAEPIHELVDPKLAVVTVQAARIRQKRGSRLVAPVAAAAAVLAIIFSGFGLAARGAQPGDTLWGLTRVLYADHARSVEAAQAVRSDLRQAEEALANGKVAEAKSVLDEVQHQLPTVASEDGKADLQAQHAALVAKLPANPAAGAPQPPLPVPTTVPATGTTIVDPVPSETTTTSPPPVTTNPTTTTPDPTITTTEPPGRVETTSNNEPGTEPATEPATKPASSPDTTEP